MQHDSLNDHTADSARKMQWKGTWNEFTGTLKQIWGDITDDDLNVAEGEFEEAIGRVQRKTGESLESIRQKIFKDEASS